MLACFCAAFLQSVGIFFGVPELERIHGDFGQGDTVIDAVVEQLGEAFGRGQAEMVVAWWTDPMIGQQIPMEHHLAATGAFLPQVFRRFPFADERAEFRPDEIREPIHDPVSVSRAVCTPSARPWT